MSKWADYVITAVRYSGDSIEQVRVYEDDGDQLVNRDTKSRMAVILNLSVGQEYCTAYKNDNGKWTKGDDVGTVEVDGTTYLRTDGNNIASDNLGELPEF
ncbi:DUF3892 domain-containing protein [Halobaculum roseum]|uniref:DUF3892 domain-containing protein n=1 Tax=Halobaculum roseum TaxID=2175149 RepID=A0ABD5MLU4_9EURY|nr:DUF3892 domain-containing protein [Halobaculum roseum]QZY04359.1 DUF3892 domain-containing protein [Halobaculum roseum]